MIDIYEQTFLHRGHLEGVLEGDEAWDLVLCKREQIFAQIMGWA